MCTLCPACWPPTSLASHTQAPQASPCQSHPHLAYADCRRQSPGPAQAGRKRAPTPSSSIPASCRFPLCPPFGSVRPHPHPVWSSRHSLSFHRNSDFPGVWRARQGGRPGGLGRLQPYCCWFLEPLSFHSFWEGTVTATRQAWQILEEEGGAPYSWFLFLWFLKSRITTIILKCHF